VAKRTEPKVVVLSDPLAIRALAHPARVAVIETLYDRRTPMTATQLGELVGLSGSAMSYHLRSLERFGVVRRADEPGDGRERPWVRAAASLSVAPRADRGTRAALAATEALVAAAMERDRTAIVAAQQRRSRGDDSVPLDAVVRYQRESLLLTPKEAEQVLAGIAAVLAPYVEGSRREPPRDAGHLSVSVTAVSDVTRPGGVES
jgi:DNA-binding transcriptional ArsR family regulator